MDTAKTQGGGMGMTQAEKHCSSPGSYPLGQGLLWLLKEFSHPTSVENGRTHPFWFITVSWLWASHHMSYSRRADKNRGALDSYNHAQAADQKVREQRGIFMAASQHKISKVFLWQRTWGQVFRLKGAPNKIHTALWDWVMCSINLWMS